MILGSQQHVLGLHLDRSLEVSVIAFENSKSLGAVEQSFNTQLVIGLDFRDPVADLIMLAYCGLESLQDLPGLNKFGE